MKIKMFQEKWHEIYFKDIDLKLSITKKADLNFFNKFYEKFFLKYNNFEDLNSNWLKNKKKTAQAISQIIDNGYEILSYGCGIGYIEQELYHCRKHLKIDCYDFIKESSKWLEKSQSITTISSLNNLKKYDVILLVQVIYALEDQEILETLNKLKKYLKPSGKIIAVNSSIYNHENETKKNTSLFKQFIKLLKDFLRPFYLKILRKKNVQFWGYERGNQTYKKLFSKADFIIKENFVAANQSFQTFMLKDK